VKAKALVAACASVWCMGPLYACGTCAEDKIAATYDHAVVQAAARAGKVVVFCEVRGPFAPAKLAAAARRVRGVDPGSIRVSQEPSALSFALDTRKQPVAGALHALQTLPGGAGVALVRVNAGP
jgi:hypothetical protein